MDASIKHLKEKIKHCATAIGRADVFVPIIIILVSFLSFGLGRLSTLESRRSDIRVEPIPVGEAGRMEATAISAIAEKQLVSAQSVQGQFVASKNGTKYYFPWCSGANRIKEENKVWFSSVDEAKRAGYSPASTCKGL